jgi:hypothetical protein
LLGMRIRAYLFEATATEARALRWEPPRAYLLANAVATGEPAQFV